MPLTIATNLSALTARNNLDQTSRTLAKSVERLSSGLKINRGADGPAALVISEKQRAQIAGLQQAIVNSSKATSLVQTAEGALGEINNLLVKVRSLALDSANAGVNDADALAANQAEIRNALESIDRISANTQFGTKKLLNGSYAGTQGTSSDSDITVLGTTADTKAGTYAIDITSVGARAVVGTVFPPALTGNETLTINGVDVAFTAGTTRDQFIDQVNDVTDQTGAYARYDADSGFTYIASTTWGSTSALSVASDISPNVGSTGYSTVPINSQGWDLTATIGGTSVTATATTQAAGTVLTVTSGDAKGLQIQVATDPTDPDIVTPFGPQGTVTVADSSLEFQIGGNQNQTAKLAIRKVDSSALGSGVAGNQFASLAEIDVSSAAKAQDAIAVIDQAISQVANQRGTLGAFQQNTLTSTTNNLRTTLENTTNAESVIRDTDFASEIAQFTKSQVLMQAGISILQNANQLPQMVLSLLK